MTKHCVPALAGAAWLAAAGGLLLGLGSGCGGDYSEKVQNWTRNTSTGASVDVKLWPAEDLAGTNPKLQLCRPECFQDTPLAGGTHKSMPPMVDIPGLKLTCEAYKDLPDNSGKQAAYYFYVGVTTAAAGAKDVILGNFKTKLGGLPQKRAWTIGPTARSAAKRGGNSVTRATRSLVKRTRAEKKRSRRCPACSTSTCLEESGQVVILAFRAEGPR